MGARISGGFLAGLAAVVVLMGCGDGDGDGGASDVRANGTDAAYLNAAIPQHEAAIDAADLALSRAEHPQLEQLAEDILQLHSAELTSLRSVRDVLQEAGVEQGDLGAAKPADPIDQEALRGASDFDCAFLEAMIPHQQETIELARAESADGIHAELGRLTELLIDEQQFAVRQMQRYQRRWCDGPAGG